MTATLDAYALQNLPQEADAALLNDGRVVIAYRTPNPDDTFLVDLYYDILSPDGDTETFGVQVDTFDARVESFDVVATAGGGFRIIWSQTYDAGQNPDPTVYQAAFTSSGFYDPAFERAQGGAIASTSYSGNVFGANGFEDIYAIESLGLSTGGAVTAVVAYSSADDIDTEIVLHFSGALSHDRVFQTMDTVADDYYQYGPSLTELANGNVVLAYIDSDVNGFRQSIITATFDRFGNEVAAPQFREFFTEAESFGMVAVEALDNGNFLMVWEDGNNMNGRIYAPNMATVSDFHFGGAQIGIALDLDIIKLANGDLAALWSSPDDNYGLHVQRFDGYDGSTIGGRVMLQDGPAAFGDYYYNYPASYTPLVGGGFLAFDNYSLGTNGTFFGQGTSQQDFAEMWNGTFLDAGLGDDVVNGSSEDDIIIGGAGSDNLNGKDGDDHIFLDDPQQPYLYDESVDRAQGGNGNDRIENAEGVSYIDGGAGNDVIIGGNSIDTMLGGLGNDILRGRMGDDVLSGGAGLDTLKGGLDNDRLDGGADKDILRGGAGNDLLDGGISNDILSGGTDNDTLIGNNGRDMLRGGQGNDLLTGGAGVDTFLFKANDMPELGDIGLMSLDYYGEAFVDIITDFGDGLDVIRLVGFTGLASFADLDIEQSDGQAIITIDDHLIVVNTLAGALDASHFQFG